MKVLVISTRVPQLDGKGDELVSYWRIAALLKGGHSVYLVCTIIGQLSVCDLSAIDYLRAVGVVVKVARMSILWQLLNLLYSLCSSSLPVQVALYRSPQCASLIARIVNDFRPDVVHAFLLRASANISTLDCRFSLDFIDSISLNYFRAAQSCPWYLRPFYLFEAKRCHRLERTLAGSADFSLAVALDDIQHISPSLVSFLPNGVDSSRFVPADSEPHEPRLIFTGNMSYSPNVAAVKWFCENCWRTLLEINPRCKFYVCGANPSRSVLALRNLYPSVFITGRVESISHELRSSTVAVAPMLTGAGMQNKILEAMSCGIPVVASSLGIGSIMALNGKELIIADSPTDFVDSVGKLLKDDSFRLAISKNARSFVLSRHSWDLIGRSFVRSLESIV